MPKDETKSMFHLAFAGMVNFGIAVFQIVIPATGPRGYIYFGTNEFLAMESKSYIFPDLTSWVLVVIFGVFGLYCLSSAELIRPLPFSTPIVWLIGGIYTLRGMAFFLLLFGLYPDTEYFTQLFVSSIFALLIGVFIVRGMKSRKEYQNGKNYQSS